MVDQEFEKLRFDERYEITTTEPWNFRKVGERKLLKQGLNNEGGHLRVWINDKMQYVHRLVANQYILNDSPETKTQVDHIDRNRLNNSLENLRWATPSENVMNRDNYEYQRQENEYLDAMPEDVYQINTYQSFDYEKYYYDAQNDRILMITVTNRIKVIKLGGKNKRISMIDINGKRHCLSHSALLDYCRNEF